MKASANKSVSKQKRKAPPHAWKKGQSGNPSGRPKVVADVRDLARQYTRRAIETLVSNLDDENGSVRNYAAEAILSRGYGKPMQPIEGDLTLNVILAERLAAARLRDE